MRYAVAQGHTVFMISWRNIPPELGALTLGRLPRARRRSRRFDVARAITGSQTRQRARLLRRRHAARVRARRARGARATRRSRARRSSPRCSTSPTRARSASTSRARRSPRASRRCCAGARHAGQRARDRVREPARQRAGVELRRQQLPEGPDAAGVRPAVLERRLREPARPDVRLLPAQHVPRQPAARAGRADHVRRAGRSRHASRMPAYVLASRDDHIVPWRSAYRDDARSLGGDATFVLGASGHIAGVVNPPCRATPQLLEQRALPTTPDDWLAGAAAQCRAAGGRTGTAWLRSARRRASRGAGTRGQRGHPPLDAAPGRYVIEKAGDARGGHATRGADAVVARPGLRCITMPDRPRAARCRSNHPTEKFHDRHRHRRRAAHRHRQVRRLARQGSRAGARRHRHPRAARASTASSPTRCPK